MFNNMRFFRTIIFLAFALAIAAFSCEGPAYAQGFDILMEKKTDKQISQKIFDFFIESCFAHSYDLDTWGTDVVGPGHKAQDLVSQNRAAVLGYPIEGKALQSWSVPIENSDNILVQVENHGCLITSDHTSAPDEVKEMLLGFTYNVEKNTGFKTYLEEDQQDLEGWRKEPQWRHYLIAIDNPNSAIDGYIFVLLTHYETDGSLNTRYYYFETDQFIKIRKLR